MTILSNPETDRDIIISPRKGKREKPVPETGILLVNPTDASYAISKLLNEGGETRKTPHSTALCPSTRQLFHGRTGRECTCSCYGNRKAYCLRGSNNFISSVAVVQFHSICQLVILSLGLPLSQEKGHLNIIFLTNRVDPQKNVPTNCLKLRNRSMTMQILAIFGQQTHHIEKVAVINAATAGPSSCWCRYGIFGALRSLQLQKCKICWYFCHFR